MCVNCVAVGQTLVQSTAQAVVPASLAHLTSSVLASVLSLGPAQRSLGTPWRFLRDRWTQSSRRYSVVLLPMLLVAAACHPSGELRPQDVAEASGIGRTINSQGENVVFDYDVDGRTDVLLSTHGTDRWQLFRGLDGGRFQETNVGTFARRDRHACAAADVNLDNLPDIYCTIGACQGTCGVLYPKEMWIQRPDHTFVDQAETWGVTSGHDRGREALFLGANNDGYPDLFVGNELGVNYPSPNRLYRNDRGRRMVEAVGDGINSEVGGNCASPGDIDRDGFTDLLVCGASQLYVYRNEGGRSFREVGSSVGLNIGYPKDGEFADLDGDGDLDLALVTESSMKVRLNRNGSFATVDYSVALDVGRDLALGDVNADGKLDIYVVQGLNDRYQDKMLVNDGSGRGFRSISIPQTTVGDGDTVAALPDWKGTGHAAFLVNNGRFQAQGPRQLIQFTA